MDNYIVKITSQAKEQMQEILHYITYELKAPEAALNLSYKLEETFSSLTHFPQRIPLMNDEPWHSKGIHHLSVNNFLIYFWIDVNNMKVQIIAIVYSKRDQLYQLSQIDME